MDRPQLSLSLNEILLSVSFALDFVEIDVLGASSNHSKRVAAIALQLGRVFGLDEAELFDLCSFSILHDNGIAEEDLHNDAVIRPEEKGSIVGLEKYSEHCEYGERNVASFPFQTSHRNIIRYHHERYDGSGFYGLSGDDIPLMAQLIAIADTVDNLFHFEREELENRKAITDFAKEGRGSWFSPEVADAFLGISSRTGFWLELHNHFIDESIRSRAPRRTMNTTWKSIYELTRVLSQVIDAKSEFTHQHSSGLEEKVCAASRFYGYEDEDSWKMCIAAHLHDLGKLAVSNSILDKPGRLTDQEFEYVRSHPFYTRKALERIIHFEDIVPWASNHHERLDGTGYPYKLRGEDLQFEDRLLMILDMYQALTEERPYRGRAFDHQETMEFLNREAARGKVDERLVSDLEEMLEA